MHIPAEDDNSSEASDSSSNNVMSFLNFGYGAQLAATNQKDPDGLDDIDHNVFFPPPPKGPPPEPPDSDEENSEDADSISADVFPSDYKNEPHIYSSVYKPDDEGDVDGIVLSPSPSDSTTGSTDQLVTGYPKVAFPSGTFLRRFSLNEATTEL